MAVPWCRECDRFLSPSTVKADGTCPTCGRAVDPGKAHAPGDPSAARASADAPAVHASADAPGPTAAPAANTAPPRIIDARETDELPVVPWHFKLLVGALAVYLGYRFLQMAEWVVHRF
ncbi:MAG: hypothetical protein U0V73_09310 [Acidimicrobiia bacterium]